MPFAILGISYDDLVTWLQIWGPFIFMGLIAFFLWRTLKLMPKTKPQQIKPASPSSIGWDDIAGVEEAKHELQEVVEFLRDPKRFQKLGATVPKGILLHGPPGTGKTLLAKAVAKESRAQFFSQSAASFVEMFAGLGAARIRRLFAIARKNAPAIIFIDELALELTARQTSGLTGADLANICNEAAIFAARRGSELVMQRDFDSGLERVIAGMQSRRKLNEHEKRVVAYHEAGHALCAELLPGVDRVHKVSIVPRGRALGYTLNLPAEDRYLKTQEELIQYMTVLLGGRAAEQLVFGAITTGAADDLRRVAEIAQAMVHDYGMGSALSSRKIGLDGSELSGMTRRIRDQEANELAGEAPRRARQLLMGHREKLDQLAESLLANEVLERTEIERVMGDASVHSRRPVTGLRVAAATEPDRPGDES